jgi:hypothetical protein
MLVGWPTVSNDVPRNMDYLHQVLNGWLMGLYVYLDD